MKRNPRAIGDGGTSTASNPSSRGSTLQIVHDVFGTCRVTASVWRSARIAVVTVAGRNVTEFSITYDNVMGDAVRNFIDAFGAFNGMQKFPAAADNALEFNRPLAIARLAQRLRRHGHGARRAMEPEA